jgi:hypothetical protein
LINAVATPLPRRLQAAARSRSRSCGRARTFPSFLEHRRRAEWALASVVATSYLLVPTRRVEKLAASLGAVGLSKWHVSSMAAELNELVDGFRGRPLGAHLRVDRRADPEGAPGRPDG